MGDRVSIQYGKHNYDGTEWLSATLKDHWGGQDFAQYALSFANKLKEDKPWSTPLSRKDPDTIICYFVTHLMNNGSANLRLVPNPEDCDNSDNGHYIIWLDINTIEKR